LDDEKLATIPQTSLLAVRTKIKAPCVSRLLHLVLIAAPIG
jgi:hypothetical protein